MKKAIILHGKPSREEYYNSELPSLSNAHWLPWLQKQLLMRNVLAQTPELPQPYEPEYESWKNVFEQLGSDDATILVGHSCGGGFLVRWLSEHPAVRVGKVVLVAPSLGLDWDHHGFFDFEIDSDIVSRTSGVTILVAKDDRDGIRQAVQKLHESIADVQMRELETGGHFTVTSMGHIEFPELMEEVIA